MKHLRPSGGGQKPPPPPYQGPCSSDEERTDEKRQEDSPEPSDHGDELPKPPNYTSKPSANPIDPFRDNAAAGASNQGTGAVGCLALSRSDSIRAIGFPESIWEVITRVIEESWGHRGSEPITSHGLDAQGADQWKLSGNPWTGFFSNAIPSKRLVANLLSAMSSEGWKVVVSTALSKHDYAKDSIFFRRTSPVDRRFFAIALHKGDRIRVLDSPNAEVSRAVNQAISTWPLGIQEVKEIEPRCLQYKLKGNSFWTANKKEQHHARVLMCHLLQGLQEVGYELVASVDMSQGSGGGESQSDVDTLVFADVGTTAGEGPPFV